MITIVDYGMANLGSILNMLKRIGVAAEATADIERIQRAEKLILPGVGAYDQAVNRLRQLNLIESLNQRVINDHRPILGICLGMQLLARASTEGELPGFGWLDATVKKFQFPTDSSLKIPHMGWNSVNILKPSPLLAGLEQPRFYFVHSYYVVCQHESDVIAAADYGGSFCAAVEHGNIFGAQFHPEKSHRYGMTVLKNFAAI